MRVGDARLTRVPCRACAVPSPPLPPLVTVLVVVASAVRNRPAGRGAPARPGRRRPSGAGSRHRGSRAPGLLYVVEQGGLVRVVKGGSDPVASRSSTCARRCARAASRACSGSRSPPTTRRAGSSSSTTRTGTATRASFATAPTAAKALPASAKQLLFVKQPYSEPQRRHGGVREGRPRLRRHGRRRLGWGSREPRAEPRFAARQDPPARSGAPRCEARDRRPRSPQSVAVLVRPRERRPLDRRRRPGLDRGGRSRRLALAGAAELRLGRLRGPRLVREQGARPGPPRQAGRAVQPRSAAARSRAATSTAARPCRPPPAGTSTATTAAARSGR